METPNYYAIIPANVRYSFEISEFQKLLYAEITALAQKSGYCYASNTYFSKIFSSPRRDEDGNIKQRSPKAISNAISDLAKKRFIKIEIDKEKGNQRKIYIGEISFQKAKIASIPEKVDTTHENMETIHNNVDTYTQHCGDPIHENVEHNNINITIKENKKKNDKKIRENNKKILESERENFNRGSIRFSFYSFLIEKLENIEIELSETKIGDINKKLNEFRERLGDERARLEIENFIEYHREAETRFRSIVARLNTWLSHLI